MTDLTCPSARNLISAQIDDELEPGNEQQLKDHLGSCASCSAYQNSAFALRRTLRIGLADSADYSTTRQSMVGSLRGLSLLRWALVIIGITLVALNLSSIISPEATTAAHLSRHDGVFGSALGVGMLAVANKPHRAIGLVPLTSAIALLMTVAAIADLVTGNVNLLAEAAHIVQFAGLICLWVISGGPSRIPKYVAAVTSLLGRPPATARIR